MEKLQLQQHEAYYMGQPDNISQVVHNALDDTMRVVALDSELRDFTLHLWAQGYCITQIEPS